MFLGSSDPRNFVAELTKFLSLKNPHFLGVSFNLGVPLVIINFRLVFSMKPTIQRTWGIPILGHSNRIFPYKPSIFGVLHDLGHPFNNSLITINHILTIY